MNTTFATNPGARGTIAVEWGTALYDTPKPALTFEAACVACGGLLVMETRNNPNRREAVAALKCSEPACRRMHVLRVTLDIEPARETKLL